MTGPYTEEGSGGALAVAGFVKSTVSLPETAKLVPSTMLVLGSDRYAFVPQLHVSHGTVAVAVLPVTASGTAVEPGLLQKNVGWVVTPAGIATLSASDAS